MLLNRMTSKNHLFVWHRSLNNYLYSYYDHFLFQIVFPKVDGIQNDGQGCHIDITLHTCLSFISRVFFRYYSYITLSLIRNNLMNKELKNKCTLSTLKSHATSSQPESKRFVTRSNKSEIRKMFFECFY